MSADVMTNVSTAVMLAVAADMLNDMTFMTEAVVGITFGFIVGVAYVVEVLTGGCASAMIGDAHGSKTGVKPSGLPAALAALEFPVPESSNKPFPCCRAPFNC